MKNLLFLSRVTFVYNVCMLLSFLMRYSNFVQEGSVRSTIIVSGLVLSVVCNVLISLSVGFLLMKGNKRGSFQPAWLFAVNFLFFIVQLYLIFQ